MTRPQPPSNTSCHHRSDASSDESGKVVMHVEQRDRVHVVLKLFAEGIRESGKTPDIHAHGETLPFHKTGAYISEIGIARHDYLVDAKTSRGAVPLAGLRVVSVNLEEL